MRLGVNSFTSAKLPSVGLIQGFLVGFFWLDTAVMDLFVKHLFRRYSSQYTLSVGKFTRRNSGKNSESRDRSCYSEENCDHSVVYYTGPSNYKELDPLEYPSPISFITPSLLCKS